MRKVGLFLIAIMGGIYVAGTLGFMPAPLLPYFESDWETATRLERARIVQQVEDAKSGDAEAQFRYAVRLLHKSADADDVVQYDPDAAVAMLEASAAQGHSLARQGLALLYIDGTLVGPDKQKVVALYTALAEDGNAAAQGIVGNLYDRGWGVEQDDALAVHYYLAALHDGVGFARFRLLKMLQEDRVPDAALDAVRAVATDDSPDMLGLRSRFNLVRLEREAERGWPTGSARSRLASENLDASVRLWSQFGLSAGAEGFEIVYSSDAQDQEMNGPAAHLAWAIVFETLALHVEKGRAARLAETMTAADVIEAKALAEATIRTWNESNGN